MNRLKSFVLNGALLTIVTLAVRTVSVAFNVYLANKTGAVAMGLFGLISTVYGFGITLASSGINLATTRLISEALGTDEKKASEKMKLIMKKSISYALFFGILAAFLLFAFSEPIGTKTLGDIRTVKSLKILSLTLPFIAVSSALGGYFSALRKVYKNAIVQIFGQFIRIYSCILLFGLFNFNDVENACISIVVGITVSELCSTALQILLYSFDRSNVKSKSDIVQESGMTKKILGITLPVALSSYARSGLVTLEHLLIPWGLKKSGSTQENSLAAYGVVHSMVFPLILFPSAISSSFAGLLIPEVAESNARENKLRIKRIAERVFRSILIFSIGTAGLIMCFSFELGNTFYPGTDSARYILMVAPLIPVMYLDTSVDSMLKGLGKQTYTMLINVIDATLSVILVFFLLPKFGIMGFIITVYFTEIINATLSITCLLNICEIKIKIYEWIVKPLICIIFATGIINFCFSLIHVVSDSKYETIFHIILGGCLYLFFLIITSTVKTKEIKNALKKLKDI